ncbi:hypothetical protein V1519DRAFT_427922 [Lipomyces tetrasporus]
MLPGHEVPSRTYYRQSNHRRLIGRASLFTAEEQPSLFHGSLQTVSSTTNPDRPYIDVHFDSQQWNSNQDFEDDVQHNYNNADSQNSTKMTTRTMKTSRDCRKARVPLRQSVVEVLGRNEFNFQEEPEPECFTEEEEPELDEGEQIDVVPVEELLL